MNPPTRDFVGVGISHSHPRPIIGTSRRSGSASANTPPGFTLIEMLVVIAIIALLASLIVGGVSNVRKKALVTSSKSKLRQMGQALLLYAQENDGYLPAALSHSADAHRGNVNPLVRETTDGYSWWMLEIQPYLGGTKDPENQTTDTIDFFIDPVLKGIVGGYGGDGIPRDRWYGDMRGGYSYNTAMGFRIGDSSLSRSRTQNGAFRQKIYKYPSGKTVVVSFGFWEGFRPNTDGTRNPNEIFSVEADDVLVDHSRRIGMDRNGEGGKSALYLMLDGGVHQWTPETARGNMKLL